MFLEHHFPSCYYYYIRYYCVQRYTKQVLKSFTSLLGWFSTRSLFFFYVTEFDTIRHSSVNKCKDFSTLHQRATLNIWTSHYHCSGAAKHGETPSAEEAYE